MKLRACCGVLDKIAATRYAAKWDNVGLLVEPANCHVKRIYLTNDLTEAVMDEAIAYGANLIISYHPPLFTSFKRISQNNWKDRLVTQALKHDIAIYSPHTAHDAWKDGVNSWLIKAVSGDSTTLPISPTTDDRKMLEVSGVWEGEKDELKQFRKQFNKLKVAEEDSKLSGWIFERDVAKYATFIGAIRDSKFISLGAQPIEGTGMGRKAKLEVPITLGEAIERTKAHLGLKHIRLVLGVGHSLETPVASVAVCAGSGASVLSHAGKVDLWITGEMGHHEALDAQQNGTTVLLAEHSNTERGFLPVFRDIILADDMVKKANIEIAVTTVDRDPIEVV